MVRDRLRTRRPLRNDPHLAVHAFDDGRAVRIVVWQQRSVVAVDLELVGHVDDRCGDRVAEGTSVHGDAGAVGYYEDGGRAGDGDPVR